MISMTFILTYCLFLIANSMEVNSNNLDIHNNVVTNNDYANIISNIEHQNTNILGSPPILISIPAHQSRQVYIFKYSIFYV